MLIASFGGKEDTLWTKKQTNKNQMEISVEKQKVVNFL